MTKTVSLPRVGLQVLGGCVFILLSLPVLAVPCMVMGERTAVLSSDEGERSPVFLAQACEKLRLKSGNAFVTWIASDGKPQMAPVNPNGIVGAPSPGREERSAKVVWSELTTNRGASRAALMRSFGEAKPSRVYVPLDGLRVTAPGNGIWELQLLDEKGARLAGFNNIKESDAVLLSRDHLPPGESRQLIWRQPEVEQAWLWRGVDASELVGLDVGYANVSATQLPDEQQQRLLKAMWFEQMRLPINLKLTMGEK